MSIKLARELLNSLPEGSVIDRIKITKQTGLDNSTLGKLLVGEFKNKNFITGDKANRLKTFNSLKKLIEDGEPIRFLDLSKKINVPPTVIRRVYEENFKGQGFLGRARNSSQVIDKIISTGVVDKDQIKTIAKDKYNINIEDRNIIKKINIAKDATVEQYVEDIRKMVKDPNYVSKYIKPAKEVGEPANLRAAKAIVANETENFKLKYDRNKNNTKRKKREADPIKREKDLVSRAERRVNRRIKEKT